MGLVQDPTLMFTWGLGLLQNLVLDNMFTWGLGLVQDLNLVNIYLGPRISKGSTLC